MKAKYALFGAVAGLSLLLTPNVLTAQSSSSGIGQVDKVNDVYGNEVLSSDNQKVGKLNNLMVDIESGRVLYGVIGASKGRVAVAPEIFTQTIPGNKELHVNVTKAKIDAAPQFSPVDKPDQWGQASFVDQVYKYFGQNAWWQGSTPANEGSFHNVHKASKVIGMKVEDVNNKSLGTINDLIVNLPQGRLVYMILSPSSSALGNNLFVLPPQAFTLSADHNNLVSGIDQHKLATAPHFDKNHWPNLSDTAFASQVYQYYGKQPYFQSVPTGR